jgi:putative oxidoreductase
MRRFIARSARLFPSIDPSWSAIPLRLIIGFGFVSHGYAKLARGPDSFIGILHALGMPAPSLLAWTTILVEVLGGLAILAGLLVPLTSVPMIFVLLVAIFTVHLPNGFSSIKLEAVTASGVRFGQPGYETDLLYIFGLITLIIVGSGPFAFDQTIAKRLSAEFSDISYSKR